MSIVIYGCGPAKEVVALQESYETNIVQFDAETTEVKSALTHRGPKNAADKTGKLTTISTTLTHTVDEAKAQKRVYQGKWFSEKSGVRIKSVLEFCTIGAAAANAAVNIWNGIANSKLTVDNPAYDTNPPATIPAKISCEFQQPWGPVISAAVLVFFGFLLILVTRAVESNNASIKRLKKIDEAEASRRKTVADTISTINGLNKQPTQVNVQNCLVLISQVKQPSQQAGLDASDLLCLTVDNLPPQHPLAKKYNAAAGNATPDSPDQKAKGREGKGSSLLKLTNADGGSSPVAAAAFRARPLTNEGIHLESAASSAAIIEPIVDDVNALRKEIERNRMLHSLENELDTYGIKINKLYNANGPVDRDLRPIPEKVRGSVIVREANAIAGAPASVAIDLSASNKNKQPEKPKEGV